MKCRIPAAVLALILTAWAPVLAEKGGPSTVSAYRVNGLEMKVRQYRVDMAPGDYIGRMIYEAREKGYTVYDGPEAVAMASFFTRAGEVYDCIYAERPDTSGTIFMAKENGRGRSVTVEVDIPVKENSGWAQDGLLRFAGSEWMLSVEIAYSDGRRNFSNVYLTKRADPDMVRNHYIKQLERNKWSVLSEKGGEKGTVIMAVRGDEVCIIAVGRSKSGRCVVSITG